MGTLERQATISECGLYRYSLTRRWGPRPEFVAFVMLNPSTADAEVDDPTIRRCIGFARAWDFDALEVVNLFALRSPNPQDLCDSSEAGIDPIGPDNDRAIIDVCGRAQMVVAAWGAHEFATPRAKRVHLGAAVHCLGRTKAGHPRHPLYVPARQGLERLS